jgi:hypothetical protein
MHNAADTFRDKNFSNRHAWTGIYFLGIASCLVRCVQLGLAMGSMRDSRTTHIHAAGDTRHLQETMIFTSNMLNSQCQLTHPPFTEDEHLHFQRSLADTKPKRIRSSVDPVTQLQVDDVCNRKKW